MEESWQLIIPGLLLLDQLGSDTDEGSVGLFSFVTNYLGSTGNAGNRDGVILDIELFCRILFAY